jgi:hypothetical protein
MPSGPTTNRLAGVRIPIEPMFLLSWGILKRTGRCHPSSKCHIEWRRGCWWWWNSILGEGQLPGMRPPRICRSGGSPVYLDNPSTFGAGRAMLLLLCELSTAVWEVRRRRSVVKIKFVRTCLCLNICFCSRSRFLHLPGALHRIGPC